MSEKTDTGKEVMDPFETERNQLIAAVGAYRGNILEAHKKIELLDSLQSIVKYLSGAKVVQMTDLGYRPLKVSLPDVEVLGTFFRELDHLKSKMPDLRLTYSGEVSQDKVLAEVVIQFKD